MPKYMFQISYTPEGVRGLLSEGGSSRRRAAEESIQGVNGSVEYYCFAYGEDDAILIADIPDVPGAVAASLVANASGAIRVKTTVLITPEEMDQAAERGRSVTYRPPGA